MELNPGWTFLEFTERIFLLILKLACGRIMHVSKQNIASTRQKKETNQHYGIKAELKKKGKTTSVDANLAIDSKQKTEKKKNMEYSYTVITGGLPVKELDKEENYKKWIQSVYKNPMPIRSQFVPISMLFESQRMREAYNEAYGFYSQLSNYCRNFINVI
ncbi:Membrane attack complex component-perforin (MACPF) domain [Babesia duncani]|uniref:Membrane attack complex component-perforin (MACPF) domain n=1 Tax=Babesia duncani TaxID=323732 RepID=A0AAD9PJA0_9APIC|nr:Membrane attack complex component-perforin (MACPF) domain [Babesia duncani]